MKHSSVFIGSGVENIENRSKSYLFTEIGIKNSSNNITTKRSETKLKKLKLSVVSLPKYQGHNATYKKPVYKGRNRDITSSEALIKAIYNRTTDHNLFFLIDTAISHLQKAFSSMESAQIDSAFRTFEKMANEFLTWPTLSDTINFNKDIINSLNEFEAFCSENLLKHDSINSALILTKRLLPKFTPPKKEETEQPVAEGPIEEIQKEELLISPENADLLEFLKVSDDLLNFVE